MMIRKFKKAESDQSGIGWLMIGAPSTYFPIGGMGVAHDLLEHRPTDSGTIEEELQALGAMIYIRGVGGFFHRERSFAFSRDPGLVASVDIASTLAFEYNGIKNGIREPPKTKVLDDFEHEAWIKSAVLHTVRRIDFTNQNDRLHPFSLSKISDFTSKIAGWLRVGFRYAQRRYSKRISPDDLSILFSQVMKCADKLLKDSEADFRNLVVKIDIKNRETEVFLEYPKEWYNK